MELWRIHIKTQTLFETNFQEVPLPDQVILAYLKMFLRIRNKEDPKTQEKQLKLKATPISEIETSK